VDLAAAQLLDDGAKHESYVCHVLQMTSLRELDLSGNLLTELPTSLATLPKLEVRCHVQQHQWQAGPAVSCVSTMLEHLASG
jgi:Leucine-rich repeat (LRR) protein